jgi:hypothetical protein
MEQYVGTCVGEEALDTRGSSQVVVLNAGDEDLPATTSFERLDEEGAEEAGPTSYANLLSE